MNPSDHNFNTHDPSAPDPDDSDYSEEWLSAYIDDELSDAQRTIVEQCIAGDGAAQQLLRELQHMRGLIGQLPAWSGEKITHHRAVDSSIDSEAFTETLEQACRSHDEASRADLESLASRVELSGEASRQNVNWWRPIALAICLALLVGGGVWWWQADDSSTLATSARTTEPADRPTENLAPLALPLETPPAELEDAASQNLAGHTQSRGAEAVRGGSDDSANSASSRAATRTEESRTELSNDGASSGLEGGMGGGLGNAMSKAKSGDMPPRMMRGAPDNAPRNASSARSADYSLDNLSPNATESVVADSPTAPADAFSPTADEPRRSSLAFDQRGSTVAVQVAYSAGWSAAEVGRGLQRLAPLLNVPQAPALSPVEGGQGARQSAPVFPVGLIAQRPSIEGTRSDTQSLPLLELLSQQPVTLQPLSPNQPNEFTQYLPLQPVAAPQVAAPQNAAAEDSATENFATESLGTEKPATEKPATEKPAGDKPATVALFVLREEADQILQAARQSGEMLANPVWVTSANGSTPPAGPKQQVVLLFTPQ